MTSYKRSVHISQHEEPWLRYPDPLKASHGHSRAFSPTPPSQSHAQGKLGYHHQDIHATKPIAETPPVPGLSHRRSASKLRQHHTSGTLPQRHHSHSHGHGQGHPHHHPHPPRPGKPKTLSDELHLALQSDDHSDTNSYSTASSNNNSTTNLYPSPVTPSDFLSIPHYASSTASTSSSSSSSHPPPRNRPESPVSRSSSISKRPSPLSINTNLTGLAQQPMPKQRPDSIHMASPTSTASRGSSSPRAAGGLGAPVPRLTHGSSFSSSASNSSCSNASSPSSSTAPCSVLCQKNHSHPHPHSHHSHHCNHSHSHHHHHASCHKHSRPHRHHHPGCQHHRGERKERPETPPLSLEEEMAAAGAAADQEVEQGGLLLPPPEPITETSLVVATFDVVAEKQEAPKHAKEPSSESTVGLYEEPPKKKMRSTAAILLGAAVETVILTSAVALSAYNLLTGKGKDQLKEDATDVVEEPKPQEPEKPVLQIQSAPVNIPRGLRHTSGAHLRGRPHHMAHSYHHTSHHYKSNKSKHKSNAALSSSLPHAQTHRFVDGEPLPGRPNTGTEDNDEQFLRMEAQLTTLIAEGKRALSSRIESWDEMSEASARR